VRGAQGRAAERGRPADDHDTVSQITDAGHRARGAATSARAATSRDLVEATVERFGGLDVLVNNAMAPTRARFDGSTVDQWDESMRVNVRSLLPLRPRRRAAHGRARRRQHRQQSRRTRADHATTPYMPAATSSTTVAKAALERFSSALASRGGALGIAVNALRPGRSRRR
jgi:NAD(P)-dependent dehydrogenase (short-subunit alcohol dehydrogenase family)